MPLSEYPSLIYAHPIYSVNPNGFTMKTQTDTQCCNHVINSTVYCNEIANKLSLLLYDLGGQGVGPYPLL